MEPVRDGSGWQLALLIGIFEIERLAQVGSGSRSCQCCRALLNADLIQTQFHRSVRMGLSG